MAGVAGTGDVYIENLRYAAAYLEARGTAAVIDPIKNRQGPVCDRPAYTTQGMHG